MRKCIGVAIALGLLVCLSSFARAQTAATDAFTFFVPYPADALDDQFDAAQTLEFRGSNIFTTISISVLRDDSLIYYDHWEDGLEPNITSPAQVSTEVWGPHTAGEVITLQNPVSVEPRDPAVLFYDGGDKIVSVGGAIAVTLAVWPETVPEDGSGSQAGILFAGAWELYPTSRWGTDYVIPVGENVIRGSGSFDTVGLNVQAASDGTLVDLDTDGDGNLEIADFVLNEGQQLTQVQGINAGAEIWATAPVQVHVFTGNPINRFEARAYTMLPRDQWTNNYLAARSSDGDFWLFNPHDVDLVVLAENITGTTSITIPASSTAKYPPAGLSGVTGVHFTAPDDFYGIAAFDEGFNQDWGYPLLPIENLTTQALIGWAPSDNNDPPGPPGDPNPDESRVYVTAIETTTVVVDYDNDGTPDAWYPVTPLTEVDITDAGDRDMTGARLHVEDDIPFIAVWGQADDAPVALPSIDVGTNVVPLRAPSIQKDCRFTAYGDCTCLPSAPAYTAICRLQVFNDGAVDFVDVFVRDNLPQGTGYVPGSTFVNGLPIPDDSAGSPFRLDEEGYNVGTVPGFGQLPISFTMLITDPGVYINQAEIISYPADPANFKLDLAHPVCRYRVAKTLVEPPSNVIDPGQVITFGLTITNTGGVTVTHLPLVDEFNEDYLTFLGASLPADLALPGVITWTDLVSTLGELPPDRSVNLALSFRVPLTLPPGVTNASNVVLSRGDRCATATVLFNGQQPPSVSFRVTCDGGAVEIENRSDTPIEITITVTIDGQTVWSELVTVGAGETYSQSRKWSDLGVSLYDGRRHRVMIQANGEAYSWEDVCHDNGNNGNGDGRVDLQLDADCWFGNVLIHNLTDEPIEVTITAIIDGKIVYNEFVTVGAGQTAEVSKDTLDWGKLGMSLADADLHTISYEIQLNGDKKTWEKVVGPCLILPETGAGRAPAPAWWRWLALPVLSLLVAWLCRNHSR